MSGIIYSSFDKFIYRTPLLHTEFDLKQSLTSGKNLFSDALFISSTDLFDSISRNKKEAADLLDKQQFSYSKYLQRSKYRATPYGLMAGVGVGTFGNEEVGIVLADPTTYSRHTRLDMSYMVSLILQLEKNDTVRQLIKYYPNSTLYTSGNKFFYYERIYSNNRRKHMLNSVEKDEYLLAVLDKAKTGAMFKQLVEVIDDPDIDITEKQDFINDIINSQLLESELEPTVTGEEIGQRLQSFIGELIQTSEGNEELQFIYQKLSSINKILDEIDANGISAQNIDLYNKVEAIVKELGAPYLKNHLFQTDLNVTSVVSKINKYCPADVLSGIDAMSRLTPIFDNTNLTKFKKAFYERWQDEEVPIVIALDPERGIGYIQDNKEKNDISPVVDDLIMADKREESQKIDVNTRLNHFWFEKYFEAIKHNKYEIALTEKDLSPFKSRLSEMPDTFTALTSVIANRGSDLPSMNKVLIRNVGGSSSSNVLARFGHANGEINDFILEMVQKEDVLAKDTILAEIVYLPESRLGNVLLRPNYRKFEIPIVCRSSVPFEKQIPISDLSICVRENRIILKSISLDKEIRPRLTNAHNYSMHSLAVYHFLSDMQTQNMLSALQIDLGIIELSAKFLPRISLNGNIILRQAKWQLIRPDYECLFGKKGNQLQEHFEQIRNIFNFPQYIAIAEADNELVIDTKNNEDLELFAMALSAKNSVRLVEFIFDPATALIRSDGYSFTNEIIFSYYREQPHPNRKAVRKVAETVQNLVPRTFYPGDDWLYFKIYSGRKSSDEILKTVIADAVKELLDEQVISKWFFIHFNDPDYHIRLRLLLTNKTKFAQVVEKINISAREYEKNGSIAKIQIDTYTREFERYGYLAISHAESLFFRDSEAVLKTMRSLDSVQWDQHKLFFALKSVDLTLESFGFGPDKKLAFLEKIRDSFLHEFNISKATKLQLDGKFRAVNGSIEHWINEDLFNKSENALIAGIIDTLKNKASYIDEIQDDLYKSFETDKIQQWLISYIHMDLNRVFRSKSRLHELVVYYYLSKYFKNQIGKLKSIRKNIASV
jgi:thiopeptide-type bacteriocin biosynthesis protein